MKLVLYSGGDSTENHKLNQRLLGLVSTRNPRMAYIPFGHYDSAEEFSEIIDQFRPYGIKKFVKWDIDRPYSRVLKETVFKADIIYLGGGNTYYFLKSLRKQGLLKELKDWVKSGGILCGLSAGAILMTKNIDTAGFPSFDRDENEENLKNLAAMDMTNFLFFPHYKSSKRYDQELCEYSKNALLPLYACPDGSGIVLDQSNIQFVGKTVCFHKGNKFFVHKK